MILYILNYFNALKQKGTNSTLNEDDYFYEYNFFKLLRILAPKSCVNIGNNEILQAKIIPKSR